MRKNTTCTFLFRMDQTELKYEIVHQKLNALSHGLAFIVSIFGGIWLLSKILQSGNMVNVLAVAFYSLSLSIVFLTSTNYHLSYFTNNRKQKRIYDHIAIFFLITGSYAPFIFIRIKNDTAYLIFVGLIIFAIIGSILKLKALEKTKWIALALYIFMGFLSVFILDDIAKAVDKHIFNLIVIAGVLYLIGVVFYVLKKIPYSHFIWHLFVIAGSACIFFAVNSIL